MKLIRQAVHHTRLNFNQKIGQYLNPAAQAMLVQLLSFSMVCLSRHICDSKGIPFPWLSLFTFQALFAVGFSYMLAMAKWWHYIHGLFPLFTCLLLKYPIPQPYYLYALLGWSAVYWTTFRSQVPYFPSGSNVPALLTSVIPNDKPIRMIDIGSGLGCLIMQLSANMPGSSFSGIEVAPLPWLISICRRKFSRSLANFHYGDYRKLNFADYDVIYAYLSPAVMTALWQKAKLEMKPGSLLISYEFKIIDAPNHHTIQAHDHSPKLHVWYM